MLSTVVYMLMLIPMLLWWRYRIQAVVSVGATTAMAISKLSFHCHLCCNPSS